MMHPPSYKALRTFCVASTSENFRAAAAALNVTPSAISHQIRILEDWVGTALFERSTRRVQLTPMGVTLSQQLGQGFRQIEDALAAAKRDAADDVLKVSTLPLFANTWLIPRLSRFEQRYPTLHIELETVNTVVDLSHSDVDVAIRNAPTHAPGLLQTKLIDLQAVPLCSPEIAAHIHSPADLSKQTLIEHSAIPDGWQRWFSAVGHDKLTPGKTLSVDNIPSGIAAAARGSGVVLGLAPFVWEAAGADQLVNPIGAPLVSGGTFTIVRRRKDQSRQVVRDFVSWLRDEMKRDYHRLLSLGGGRNNR